MAYNFLFANNATTTLAQAISATATVITVASGDGALFPSPNIGQAFAITLVDAATGLTNEICYCTSRSGDELTVIRGQEGKNATSWSAGDTCANYITAGVFATWLNEGVADARYLMLNNSATQAVSGPVEFDGIVTVPAVQNNFTTRQAADALSVKNNFIKQGWNFSNFGTNQVYLGWRKDGSGLGIGIDSTDEGNVAIQGAGKLGLGDWTEQNYTLPSGGNRTVALTFTAPSAGYVHVIGSANFAVQNTNQTQLTVVVNSNVLSADNVTNTTCMTNHACVAVSAGPVTVGSFLSTSATNPPNVGHTLSYIFVPS